jgi:hypothetical protein
MNKLSIFYIHQCRHHTYMAAIPSNLFPAEDVRYTRDAPPNAHDCDKRSDDLDNHHDGHSHQHARHEDTVQHQMSPQPRSLDNGGDSDGSIEKHVGCHSASDPT